MNNNFCHVRYHVRYIKPVLSVFATVCSIHKELSINNMIQPIYNNAQIYRVVASQHSKSIYQDQCQQFIDGKKIIFMDWSSIMNYLLRANILYYSKLLTVYVCFNISYLKSINLFKKNIKDIKILSSFVLPAGIVKLLYP